MSGEDSRAKGKLFEEQVAHFLEKRGWTPTLGHHFEGKIALRKHDCDVLASRLSFGWLFVVVVCLALVAAGVSDLAGILPAQGSGGIMVVAGLLIGPGAWKSATRLVWVECKNLNQSIRRDLIIKLSAQFADAAKKYGTWECWLVSTSRFDEDAVAHAKAHGVRCYRVVDPGERNMALHEVRATTGDV